jgi:hypothetical protein
MPDKDIYFNGVNGVTGEYIAAPLSLEELAHLIKTEPVDKAHADRMARTAANLRSASFGLPFGMEPSDIRQTGWAIVFHTDEAAAVKDALAPLIAHRRSQVGAEKTKVLQYCPNETWLTWLARHGATPGDVDPAQVPYYVLLVGDPSLIPYDFNYLLDVDYAVGRLSFDTPPPALLFTATHGVDFLNGHAQQYAAQGALLCQD